MRYLNKLLATGVLLVATTIMSFALKAEYRFEKCDGSASLENHAGNTLVGELSGDANISLGDGKIVNALSLSGDGMMSVEHNANLDLVNNLTIAFWVNPNKNQSSYSLHTITCNSSRIACHSIMDVGLTTLFKIS